MKSFLKDINFHNFYNGTPHVFVSADHSSKGGNISPVHNGITAWIEVRSLIYNLICNALLFQTKTEQKHLKFVFLFASYFYSISTRLVSAFVSKNYLKQNTTLCPFLTLFCQVVAELFYTLELINFYYFLLSLKPLLNFSILIGSGLVFQKKRSK